MPQSFERKFDLIVVGGGHSGSEAAHATAKLGFKTLLITNSIDQIASMPCNPAIGGPAKSHLVKEIDALGGIMGLAADATYIQMKTLNSSRGPAVRALRAQSDKKEYSAWVREYLENLPNLSIYQSSAKSLIINDDTKILGIETNLEEKIYADAVIVTAGTFLEARIFSGDKFEAAGRAGEKPSLGLSPKLRDLGLKTGRLKTGTPARLDRRSINFDLLELAPGDEKLNWFSFLPNRPIRPQYPCHITRSNNRTHEIIMENLDKSPMYSGLVEANGPRYCPSIEDKVVRFAHNPSHHFFLEPESLSSNEIYLQGCSTSLPIEVQWQMIRTLPGLENVTITRPAYAVEYDYFPAIQFKHSLESKTIDGLFVAGQVLGTSGYEEAAAQGIMAGINAAIKLARLNPENKNLNPQLKIYSQNNDAFILDRSTSYIGTLIDDLVSKEINDPYRMLTSRSEYRLILRQDNADQRLTPIGRELGLVDDYRFKYFNLKQERINKEIKFFNQVKVSSKEALPNIDYKPGEKISLADLVKHQDFSYEDEDLYSYINLEANEIRKLKEKNIYCENFEYSYEVATAIKYAGYINRQQSSIDEMKKFEAVKIPEDFDFKSCQHISLEARDKLAKVQPRTLGQASRIGGITPNDVSVLSIIFSNRTKNAEFASV